MKRANPNADAEPPTHPSERRDSQRPWRIRRSRLLGGLLASFALSVAAMLSCTLPTTIRLDVSSGSKDGIYVPGPRTRPQLIFACCDEGRDTAIARLVQSTHPQCEEPDGRLTEMEPRRIRWRLPSGSLRQATATRGHRPRTTSSLFLADEPAASLDSKSGREIVDLMRQLAREQDCSVLIVAITTPSLPGSDIHHGGCGFVT